MPMYEYVCGGCGHHVEVLQKISDAPLIQCMHCKAERLEKLVSKSGFRLKGEGWYETDFKGGDSKRNLVDKPEQELDKGATETVKKETQGEANPKVIAEPSVSPSTGTAGDNT